jgi:hypothetical protein
MARMKAVAFTSLRSAALALIIIRGSEAGAATQTPVAMGLPPETVTVTAVKPSETVIQSYIEKRMAPTRVVGRLPRWIKKMCPQTVGLGPAYAKYITQRIRNIGAAVGAPLDPDLTCRPNVEVVFTITPQGLIDNVRRKQPILLGYHDNLTQADRLANVTQAIQAWYTTESMDMDGARFVDSGRCGSEHTVTIGDPGTSAGGNLAGPGGEMQPAEPLQLSLPCAIVVHSSGSRAHDGLSSGLFNVIIAAEPAKLYDYEIGTLADYIAMLALSQPPSQDTCQDLPSISNLLARGCTAPAASHITDGDLAYLRGLYKMPEGIGLAAQINQLRYEMNKTLVTDKGGAN